MTDNDWLLLCDPSPALRYRVLTELMSVPPDDPEALDLAARRTNGTEVAAILAQPAPGMREQCWQLCRLGQLGLDKSGQACTRPG